MKCLYTIHQKTELSQELITILHFLCQNPPRTDNPHTQPKMVNKPFCQLWLLTRTNACMDFPT